MRQFDPRYQPGNFEKNLAATDQLVAVARSKGATVAQLALAWLLAQGEDIVPIPGTRSQTRLTENVGAASVELTAADLARVHDIVPNGAFGARYIDRYMPTWV